MKTAQSLQPRSLEKEHESNAAKFDSKVVQVAFDDSMIEFAFSALPTCEVLGQLLGIFYLYFEKAMYFVLSCADIDCVFERMFPLAISVVM